MKKLIMTIILLVLIGIMLMVGCTSELKRYPIGMGSSEIMEAIQEVREIIGE